MDVGAALLLESPHGTGGDADGRQGDGAGAVTRWPFCFKILPFVRRAAGRRLIGGTPFVPTPPIGHKAQSSITKGFLGLMLLVKLVNRELDKLRIVQP
jgi:hypothetical protein